MARIILNVLKRIKVIMKDKGINQKDLGDKCGFSQAKISNILSNKGRIEFEDIEVICHALEVRMEDIVKEENNTFDKQEIIYRQINESFTISDSNFIIEPSNMAFQGYFGEYFVYLYPTRSSETNLLKGRFTIKADKEGKICRASLKIFTGKVSRDGTEIEKEFTGQVILSLPMSSMYCILINHKLAEINFLTFRHMFILNEDLICRLATLSTVSSGDARRPSTLRILLTRIPMEKEEELSFVKAQLLQNQSDITISKEHYDELIRQGTFSEEFQNAFQELRNERKMYTIEESRLRSLLSDKKERLDAIANLRNSSEAMRYNKIGTKADEQIYQYIQNKLYKKQEEL